MQRNKLLAMGILKVVEANAGVSGISFPMLRAAYDRMNYVWDNGETYLLDLLVEGGYLSKVEGSPPVADYVQLTWKGHDLLDSLKEQYQ
ncbi:hypothetical protein [Pseudomonas extremaustralis]|uniref:hypothetical protein n=1 Tax=Pseudomonas extremaustralis TaxID=359110 RepID=UPI0023DF2F30|nr:hypothetical protein [Pseudomonas extremaustralis]MDF3134495.1 hypothetical protein [Pseudomonas extremaustralis]